MHKQKSDDYEDEILEHLEPENLESNFGLGDNYRTGLKSQNQNKFQISTYQVQLDTKYFKTSRGTPLYTPLFIYSERIHVADKSTLKEGDIGKVLSWKVRNEIGKNEVGK